MIKKGSTVSINYTLTVDGKVVDTSVGREPLNYVQGAGQIIPGLEEALEGLKASNKKQVTVMPDKGYGKTNPEAIRKVPKKAFQNSQTIKVGDVVSGQAGGRQFQATVAEMNGENVTIDLNHPLAGKTLHFDVEVMEVKPGS